MGEQPRVAAASLCAVDHERPAGEGALCDHLARGAALVGEAQDQCGHDFLLGPLWVLGFHTDRTGFLGISSCFLTEGSENAATLA